MNGKRLLIIGSLVILTLLSIGYHLVFGYVTVSQVNDSTYLLHRENLFTQIGANVIVHVGITQTTVVDSQLGALAAPTREQAEQLSKLPIGRLIITHWHPDHSGGIAAYSADTQVIAHANTFAILSQSHEGFGLTKPGSHHEFAAREPQALPTLTVDKRLKQDNADTVHYANAHTGGDLVMYFEGVVAIGDLVWPGSFPFIDIHNGGSVVGLETALKHIINRTQPGDQYIPGHGGVISHKDVSSYLHMVATTRAYVDKQKQAGKSLDEIIRSGLPDKWAPWSSALVPESEWITFVFKSQ